MVAFVPGNDFFLFGSPDGIVVIAHELDLRIVRVRAMRKMHAEHVPLSATAKRLRLRRLRLGVTRGVGAAMASCTWSDEETFVLIEIWGEDSIQAMLEGTRRNKDVFVKIAKAIEKRGFLRAILYTYYGIPLRMRKYTQSAPFYVGNPFGLCKCERVLERFCEPF